MVGAKTITSITLFVVMTTIVSMQGYLDITYLMRLDPWAAAFLGIFATLTGTMVVKIWRLDEQSVTGFSHTSAKRISEEEITLVDHLFGKIKVGESIDEPPRDLPPSVQRIIYTVVFLWIGLFTFNNRTFEMLMQIPDRFWIDSGRYCDDTRDKEVSSGDDSQGCELVLRAYRLGFAEDLGPCEKKDTEKESQPCTLRQREEPYLHYAWRLLTDQISPLIGFFSLSEFDKFKREFRTKLDHIDTLYHVQSRAITSMYRASHHLFTNLPHPRYGESNIIRHFLDSDYCTELMSHREQRIAIASRDVSLSSLLEEIHIQLFLEPAYRPIVGVCGEYIIHWNVPDDACLQLEKNPQAFLEKVDAWSRVLQVVKRQERDLVLKRKQESGVYFGLAPVQGQTAYNQDNSSRAINRVVSFQCFMEGTETGDELREYSFDLLDHDFRAVEIRFSSDISGQTRFMELSRKLAVLHAPDFRYGQFLSRASITQRDQRTPIDDHFSNNTYRLSKLEYLRDLDLFLDDQGIEDRADLYEVYPYYLHLRNFVEVFRQYYKLHRDRL